MSTIEQRQELVNRMGEFVTNNADLIRLIMEDRDEFIMASPLDMTKSIQIDDNLIYVKLFGDSQ